MLPTSCQKFPFASTGVLFTDVTTSLEADPLA